MFTTFTIVSSLASLLSFIFQMKNTFPKYTQLFRNFGFLFVGMLIGEFFAATNSISLNFALTETLFSIVIIFSIFLCVVMILFFLSRENLFGSIGSGTVILVLLFSFALSNAPQRNDENYSLQEIFYLAQNHRQSGNPERAKILYKKAMLLSEKKMTGLIQKQIDECNTEIMKLSDNKQDTEKK